MSEFNYQKAWLELAKPAYESLPADIRDLVAAVGVECKDFRQDKITLDLPWPGEEDYAKMANPPQDWLFTRFNSIDSDWLAPAAHVVYFFGHWAYGKHTVEAFQPNGTYWKFSNLADQVLRKRLNLPKESKSHVGFKVNDGFLRMYLSTTNLWTWQEVGLATHATLKKAQSILDKTKYLKGLNSTYKQALTRQFEDDCWNELKSICDKIVSDLPKDSVGHNFIVKIKNYYD